MRACWQWSESERPSFADIHASLQEATVATVATAVASLAPSSPSSSALLMKAKENFLFGTSDTGMITSSDLFDTTAV